MSSNWSEFPGKLPPNERPWLRIFLVTPSSSSENVGGTGQCLAESQMTDNVIDNVYHNIDIWLTWNAFHPDWSNPFIAWKTSGLKGLQIKVMGKLHAIFALKSDVGIKVNGMAIPIHRFKVHVSRRIRWLQAMSPYLKHKNIKVSSGQDFFN